MKTPHIGNAGSGLITVLLTVMFIVTLGGTLLYTSYTGYEISAASRRSEENFYDAEGAMEQVKLAVQDFAAKALGEAWADTLSSYNSIRDTRGDKPLSDALQDSFTASFKTELKKTELFTDISGANYNLAVLQNFLGSNTKAVLSGSGSVNNLQDDKTVLEKLTLTYTDAGYEDSITTDIIIHVPPFSYQPSASIEGVVPAALIAQGGLNVNVGGSELSGDAYAGSVSVNQNAMLTVRSGKLVSGGEVSLANGGTLSSENGTQLWAWGYTLGSDAKLSLAGDAYAADDLTVNGSDAEVILSGSYTGFGYTTDANLYGDGVAERNSSILINGRDAELKLKGLKSLILAGSAYISKDGDATAGSHDILMGQSIAVRSDQLAYLVPDNMLGDVLETNPCILPTDEATALTDNQLQKIKAIADDYYKISAVKPIYRHVGTDSTMIYLFMEFETRADANSFFIKYFDFHDSVNEYAKQYLNTINSAGITFSAGAVYSQPAETPGSDLSVVNASGAGGVTAYCDTLRTNYTSLCRTLSETGVPGDSIDIYNYYVNQNKLNALRDNETVFKKDGVTLGYIVKGDCNATTLFQGVSTDLAKILICDGNVTVSGDFKGAIIASGTVTLNGSASVTASSGTAAALLARNESGETIMSYFNGGDEGGSASTEPGGSWDMAALVDYVNWKKN